MPPDPRDPRLQPPSPYPAPPVAPAPQPFGYMPAVQPFKSTVRFGGDTIQGPQDTGKVKGDEFRADQNAIADAQRAQDEAARKDAEAKQQIERAEAIDAEQRADWAKYHAIERETQARHDAEALAKLTAVEADKRKTMESSAKITDYWADQTTPARILSAVLIGLGEGASGGGGSSSAFKIYQNAAANYRTQQQDRHAADTLKHRGAQEDTAASSARAKQRQVDIANAEIVRADILTKELDALKKKVPRAAVEAEALQAKLDEERAKANAALDLNFQHTVTAEQITRHRGKDTTSVEGEKTPGGTMSPTEKAAAAAAAANVAEMEDIKDTIRKRPEIIQGLQKKRLDWDRRQASSKTLFGGVRDYLVGAGAADVDFSQTLTDEERTLYRKLDAAETASGKAKLGAGVYTDVEHKATVGALGTKTGSPAQVINTLDDMEKKIKATAPVPTASPGPTVTPGKPTVNANTTGTGPTSQNHDRLMLKQKAGRIVETLLEMKRLPRAERDPGVEARLEADRRRIAKELGSGG